MPFSLDLMNFNLSEGYDGLLSMKKNLTIEN